MLTVAEVSKALPAKLKVNANQKLVDKISNITNDPDAARIIRDNFISYTSVLQDGRFKTEDYLSAVSSIGSLEFIIFSIFCSIDIAS